MPWACGSADPVLAGGQHRFRTDDGGAADTFPSHGVSAKARSALSAHEESAAVVPSQPVPVEGSPDRRGVTTSLLPTSRWRPSTASATTAISSAPPPVPLPDQREAGFQRMPWVFGKPRLDLGFYRSDQII